jgi:hypothetical protein
VFLRLDFVVLDGQFSSNSETTVKTSNPGESVLLLNTQIFQNAFLVSYCSTASPCRTASKVRAEGQEFDSQQRQRNSHLPLQYSHLATGTENSLSGDYAVGALIWSRLRMCGVSLTLPHTSSWCGVRSMLFNYYRQIFFDRIHYRDITLIHPVAYKEKGQYRY